MMDTLLLELTPLTTSRKGSRFGGSGALFVETLPPRVRTETTGLAGMRLLRTSLSNTGSQPAPQSYAAHQTTASQRQASHPQTALAEICKGRAHRSTFLRSGFI